MSALVQQFVTLRGQHESKRMQTGIYVQIQHFL